jgi:hypothetical protein
METNEEIARRYDAVKARGEELANLAPVQARVPRNADSIYSLRFTSEEMRTLSAAAKASGIKLSQFIRAAALDRAGSNRSDPASPPLSSRDRELEKIQARLSDQGERTDRLEQLLLGLLAELKESEKLKGIGVNGGEVLSPKATKASPRRRQQRMLE